ncbi:hypothetical protein [Paracoccus benzoatiresistens]|uniref:Nickel/cobalt transporter regulator n=1 Tax=Paracoccus benzoatiresistens TaxID=2997341 RepID=A0ABT4J404_9RHOB|nr:hypothetical protein [Paracoccus sp. EF6]MCZ0961121.1 hypothetical protein [Paracoccus sp. EF6]
MTGKLIAIAAASVTAVIGAIYADHGPQAQGAPDHALRPSPLPVLAPGDVIPADQVDFIERPGHYGLGSGVRGSRYAIVGDHLVRIDPETLQLKSILRSDVNAAD